MGHMIPYFMFFMSFAFIGVICAVLVLVFYLVLGKMTDGGKAERVFLSLGASVFFGLCFASCSFYLFMMPSEAGWGDIARVPLGRTQMQITDGSGWISGDVKSKYSPSKEVELNSVTRCVLVDDILIGELSYHGTGWFWYDTKTNTGARFTLYSDLKDSLYREFTIAYIPPLMTCQDFWEDYWD